MCNPNLFGAILARMTRDRRGFLGPIAVVVILIFPSLPSLDPLTNYQPRIPLRIYTADDVLIGELVVAMVEVWDTLGLPRQRAVAVAAE